MRVGSDDTSQDFVVHEWILRSHSPFFDAALRNHWKEAEERLVKLPSDDPEAFRFYVGWMYFHNISTDSGSESKSLLKLVHAYVLGDILQDGDFRDAMIDSIKSQADAKGIHLRTYMKEIYNNTKEDDPLRALAVDILVFNGSEKWLVNGQQKKDVPEDALWDMLTRMVKCEQKPKTADAPYRNGLCHCHVHASGSCYISKHI